MRTSSTITARDDAQTMRRFFNEFLLATGRDGRNPFSQDAPELPTVCGHTQFVTLPRQELVRFRNGYRLLLEFAALKCGRPIEELAPIDLMTVWPFPVEPDEDEF